MKFDEQVGSFQMWQVNECRVVTRVRSSAGGTCHLTVHQKLRRLSLVKLSARERSALQRCANETWMYNIYSLPIPSFPSVIIRWVRYAAMRELCWANRIESELVHLVFVEMDGFQHIGYHLRDSGYREHCLEMDPYGNCFPVGTRSITIWSKVMRIEFMNLWASSRCKRRKDWASAKLCRESSQDVATGEKRCHGVSQMGRDQKVILILFRSVDRWYMVIHRMPLERSKRERRGSMVCATIFSFDPC